MKKVIAIIGKAVVYCAVPVLAAVGGYYLMKVTAQPVSHLIEYSISHFSNQETNKATDDMGAAIEKTLEGIENDLGDLTSSAAE